MFVRRIFVKPDTKTNDALNPEAAELWVEILLQFFTCLTDDNLAPDFQVDIPIPFCPWKQLTLWKFYYKVTLVTDVGVGGIA